MSNYKVYCLTNKITGKKYIGVTKQKLYDRFKAGKGYKPTTKINQAILKYGWINFEHEILFITENKELAEEMEKFFIKFYNTIENGYNITTGGSSGYSTPGYIMTEKHRENLSVSHKGKHYSPATEFKKGKLSQRNIEVSIPVICIETNIIYTSIAEAEKQLGISHHVWDCINGKRNKCGGYHWKKVERRNEDGTSKCR